MKRSKKKTARIRSKIKQKIAQPPGTLIYTGKVQRKCSFTLIKYNEESHDSVTSTDLDEITGQIEKDKINWINIDGLSETGKIAAAGKYFQLHPLLLEDILNINQLPKVEDYESYLFITLKMLSLNPESDEIQQEQISFILGDNYLLSFQERKGDVFDVIRERLLTAKGKVRKQKADYLLYRLVDTIVDHYYLIIDHFEEQLNVLESEIIETPELHSAEKVNNLKKMIIQLKRSVFPLQEALKKLNHQENRLIRHATERYFKDVQDHIAQISSSMEILREHLSGLMDLYMSINSNKMNNVMKTLTIIATIFIPLTFIAGVYGMNFEYMPELTWKWGYFAVLLLMLIVAVIMLFYMRSKKWF